MPITAIVGTQWGDEGKGKFVDVMAEEIQAAAVARFQGGNNAGHTLVIGDKTYKLHFVPSGVARGLPCYIGRGVVLHPESFLKEVNILEDRLDEELNLMIDERCHIITDAHIEEDSDFKDDKEGLRATSTNRGIRPVYRDLVDRKGTRAFEFAREECPDLKKYLGDVTKELYELLRKNKMILAEGAQGTQLDVLHGAYPMVTSSITTAGNVSTGLGVGPTNITRVIGIMKAYISKVGAGVLPTQIDGKIAEYIIEKGREYGTTTGRKRRVGWFDCNVGRYAARINGLNEIFITKLDVLAGLENVYLCDSYKDKNDKFIQEIPASFDGWNAWMPKTWDGWPEVNRFEENISDIREFLRLPIESIDYLREIASRVGVPITKISVGADREQTINHTISIV